MCQRVSTRPKYVFCIRSNRRCISISYAFRFPPKAFQVLSKDLKKNVLKLLQKAHINRKIKSLKRIPSMSQNLANTIKSKLFWGTGCSLLTESLICFLQQYPRGFPKNLVKQLRKTFQQS